MFTSNQNEMPLRTIFGWPLLFLFMGLLFTFLDSSILRSIGYLLLAGAALWVATLSFISLFNFPEKATFTYTRKQLIIFVFTGISGLIFVLGLGISLVFLASTVVRENILSMVGSWLMNIGALGVLGLSFLLKRK